MTMKIKDLHLNEIPERRRLPTIAFTKLGIITISAAAVFVTSMKPGDLISIAPDEDRENDWYLFKAEKETYNWRLRENLKALSFNSLKLVRVFAASLGFSGTRRIVCLIGSEPVVDHGVEYWPIITKSAKELE